MNKFLFYINDILESLDIHLNSKTKDIKSSHNSYSERE